MIKKSRLYKLLNFWPPYLGAGIRITKVSPDVSSIEVEMKLRFWNRSYVKAHFGGSLYAMTDPFFMLILMEHLGPNYVVWDKAATIRFKRPGRSHVHAKFEIPLSEIAAIRQQADIEEKVEPTFRTQILNDAGEVVAEVEKLLWVKRKDKMTDSK